MFKRSSCSPLKINRLLVVSEDIPIPFLRMKSVNRPIYPLSTMSKSSTSLHLKTSQESYN